MSDSRGVRPTNGVVPILLTPCADDGKIDYQSFDRQVEFLLDKGVEYVGFGYGSEIGRLSAAQLLSLVNRTAKLGGPGLGVIGNVELASVSGGLEAAEALANAGARHVMVRLAGMAQVPSQRVVDTIAEFLGSSPISTVLQDAPQNTGVTLPTSALTTMLKELPNIVAVKIESPDAVAKIREIAGSVQAEGPSVLAGSGGIGYLFELINGASGTMPGPALPEIFAELKRRHDEGRLRDAFELYQKVAPLLILSLSSMDTFLRVQKHILVRRRIFSTSTLLPPSGDIDSDVFARVDYQLDELGILDMCESL